MCEGDHFVSLMVLLTLSLFTGVIAAEWHMQDVVSFQARIQGDKPIWDAEHRTFVSSFGSTFAEKYQAPMDTVNFASVEGVLKYVQSEGINSNVLNPAECQRKNKMQYIVFYKIHVVQTNASLALYQLDPNLIPEYCPFIAMDRGMCTPVSGSTLSADCLRLFSKSEQPPIGPCVGASYRSNDPQAPYPNTIWFSYPNSCMDQPWDAKTAGCRQSYPGGLCPFGVKPDGVSCTYSYSILGYLNLDDLVGITELTHSQTRQRYQSYKEFCQDKTGAYKGIEFTAPLDATNNQAVVSLPFWAMPFDKDANIRRTQQMIAKYNQLAYQPSTMMQPLPSTQQLKNPPCYKNSKLCFEAPFGCKRELFAQICQRCSNMEPGCEKPQSNYTFPTLTVPTYPPNIKSQAGIGALLSQGNVTPIATPSIGIRSLLTWHVVVLVMICL